MSLLSQTRQTVYVQRNIEARSCNHCFSGKAMSVTYCEPVMVALVMQHAMRMHHVVICGLPHCTIYLHIPRLKIKKIKHKLCFDFLYNFYLKHFAFQEEPSEVWSKMSSGVHVQYPSFLSDFIGTWPFSTVFRKFSHIKFQENLSSVSRIVACERMNGRTDRWDEANDGVSQFCEHA